MLWETKRIKFEIANHAFLSRGTINTIIIIIIIHNITIDIITLTTTYNIIYECYLEKDFLRHHYRWDATVRLVFPPNMWSYPQPQYRRDLSMMTIMMMTMIMMKMIIMMITEKYTAYCTFSSPQRLHLYFPLRDTLVESNLSNVCKLSLLLSDDAELLNMDDLSIIIGSMNMVDLSESTGFIIVIIIGEDPLKRRWDVSRIFLILDGFCLDMVMLRSVNNMIVVCMHWVWYNNKM